MTDVLTTNAQIPDHTPEPVSSAEPAMLRAQSLADGTLAGVLLHIERALAEDRGWEQVRDGMAAAVAGGVKATGECGLYRGAPAVAFLLHIAAAGGPQRFLRARETLDAAVACLTHRRVRHALDRIRRGAPPHMAEYDLISGLTGIGAHLLAHHPGGDALGRVLDYLVALTEPVLRDGQWWPGWWTAHGPDGSMSARYPSGHANLGLAHGITGPLALLALTARQGIAVDGHRDAIDRLCAWLDNQRRDDDTGCWWPQWIIRDQHLFQRSRQTGPGRPSWCYGTPGIARALHLAGIATGDTARRVGAEHALAACLTDAEQTGRLTDDTVCHGWAGLTLTTWRTATDPATDAATSPLVALLPSLIDQLRRRATSCHRGGVTDLGDHAAGLLEGRSGTELVLDTVGRPPSAATGWDRCLLIT